MGLTMRYPCSWSLAFDRVGASSGPPVGRRGTVFVGSRPLRPLHRCLANVALGFHEGPDEDRGGDRQQVAKIDAQTVGLACHTGEGVFRKVQPGKRFADS